MSGWGLVISCHSLVILFGVQWGGDTLEEKQSEESRELSHLFSLLELDHLVFLFYLIQDQIVP